MPSPPPDPNAIDLSWELDDQEDADSTRMVDSSQLLAQAGFDSSDQQSPAEDDEQAPSSHEDGKITLPPPMPADEYVARMMDQPTISDIPGVPRSVVPWKSPTVGENYEATLNTLLDERSFGLECDDLGISSNPDITLDSTVDDPHEDEILRMVTPVVPPDEFNRPSYDEIGSASSDPIVVPYSPRLLKNRPDVDDDAPTPPPGTLRFGLPEEVEDVLEAHGISTRQPQLAIIPPAITEDPHQRMKERFDAGDFSTALVLAEALLDEDPDDRTAHRYADSCSELLRQMYKARIGDGAQIPRIMINNEQLRSLNLDHRAGFLLSCIDGASSIDEILDVSGMRPLEALRILYELIQGSIITCDE